MSPIVITIDGIDGCGKRTTAENLARELTNKQKMKVKILSFPMYDSKNSILIRDFLSGDLDPDKKLNPYTKAMLFTLERRIYLENNLDKLKEYDCIIMDRSFISNIIYQLADLDMSPNLNYLDNNSANRGRFIMDLLDMEFNYSNGMLFTNPFSLFYLYTFHFIIYHELFETSIGLLNKREANGQKFDENEKNTEYLKKCYDDQFFVFDFLSNKNNLREYNIRNANFKMSMLKISDKKGIIKMPNEVVSDIINSIYNKLT